MLPLRVHVCLVPLLPLACPHFAAAENPRRALDSIPADSALAVLLCNLAAVVRIACDNVSVEFHSAEEGETRGVFVADSETYGVDRLWVLVRPIPISLDSDGSSPPDDSDDD